MPLKILMVEDNASDAQLINAVLQKEGLQYEHTRVDNLEALFLELENFSPDLVLSDFSLPSLTGLDVLQQVKKLKPQLPIILVTGSQSETIAVECMKAGAADYILKDKLFMLMPAINTVLERLNLEKKQKEYQEQLTNYKNELENQYQELLMTKEKLWEVKENYFQLYEYAPAGYLSFDREGIIKEANITAATMLGVDKEYLLATNFFCYLDQRQKKNFSHILKTVFEKKLYQGYLLKINSSQGQDFYAKLNFAPSQLNSQLVNATMFDITDRIKMEEALQKSEANTRALLESGRIAYVMLDLSMKIVTFNSFAEVTMQKISGRKIENGQYFANYIFQESLQTFHIIFREVLSGAIIERKVYLGNTWFMLFFNPIFTGTKITGICFSALDITREETAEIKRKESEKLYGAIVNNMEGFLYICQEDGIIEFANKNLITKLGRNPRGEHCYQAISQQEKPCPWCKLAEKNSQKAYNWEYFNEQENKWYYATATKIIHEDKSFSKLVIYNDITERKQRENHLHIQKETALALNRCTDLQKAFRVVIEHLILLDEVDAVGIYLFKEDALKMEYSLQTSEEFLRHHSRYEKDSKLVELISNSKSLYGSLQDYQHLYTEDYKSFAILPLTSNREALGSIHLLSRKPDAYSYLTRHFLESFVNQISDVLSRIKTMEALKESETKFRAIFDNSQDGISIFERYENDTRRKIIDCNTSYCHMAGRTKEELMALEDIRDIQERGHSERLSAYLQTKIEKGLPYSGTFSWKRPDKVRNFIEFRAMPVVTGDKILVYGIDRDITQAKDYEEEMEKYQNSLEEEVKKRTEELERAKQHAEEANDTKSIFLANMSHEIRTPLNIVLGFTELLQGSINDKTQQEYLVAIQKSGNNLLHLINDILDLSKIEAGKLEIKQEPVCLHDVLREIKEIFSASFQQKRLSYLEEIDKNIPSELLMDETRLRQVLVNLIGNAIKFTDHGYVKLSVLKTGFYEDNTVDLRFSVEDSGIGIEGNDLENIFAAFKQQEGQSTRKYGGTGLGLTISKRLIEMMGGCIRVKSTPSIGSNFVFTLKRVKILKEREHIKEDKNYDIPSSFTIVIADDEKTNRSLIKQILKDYKMNIIEAENGQEAVEAAKSRKPKVILMDIHMPVLGGFEACQEIKDHLNLRNIPIICMSGNGLSEKEVYKSGFDGHLEKPFTKQTVLSLLSNLAKNEPKPAQDEPMLEEDATAIQLALPYLLEEIIPDWERVSKMPFLGDITLFAEKLERVATDYSLPTLGTFAHDLRQAGQSFNVEKINSLLTGFISIIDAYKQNKETP